MKQYVLSLVALVLSASAWAQDAPARKEQADRKAARPLIGQVLRMYQRDDPKGHAELMKLRETDREAFRKKVGELLRKARQDPELRKKLAARPAPAAKFQVPDTVKVVRDIVYARYGDREVKLDLYLPKDPPAGKLPCVVTIHGGGWRSGNKERFARFAAQFAQKGFAAPCVGYRLIPEVQIPQCVEDVKASVRWVRANAEKYHIDAGRIGAFGGSAGAHLAAMLGTSFKEKKLEGKGGNEQHSSRVHAVVAMATPADMTTFRRASSNPETAKLISPASYVDSDSATFLLMHATGDRTVPYKQSTILLEKLKAAKVPAALITIEGGSHAFWNARTPVGAKAVTDAVAFFEKTLKAKKVEPE